MPSIPTGSNSYTFYRTGSSTAAFAGTRTRRAGLAHRAIGAIPVGVALSGGFTGGGSPP